MAIILIVDDEEMDRTLERVFLEAAGHQLLFASDGGAALKIFKERDVDLLVTDLAMPGYSGLRLIKELREGEFTVPIIALSGWATDQLELARDYGANVVLTKPIGPAELFDALDEALQTTLPRPPTDLFSRDETIAHRRKIKDH